MAGSSRGGDGEFSLKVRNARVKFDGNEVLSGLNMTVPKGSMYTLIGSSGCGKTTLLNCILGLTTLDSGYIYRDCSPTLDIGHMPQEIALAPMLTIQELFSYFKLVYGIDSEDFKKRCMKLNDIFELPPGNSIINTLSGGEQRRVSLAMTLLHEPKVLILDEPTVGQDPLLRKSMWDFLVSFTREGNRTVLLTTHYVEEAKQADLVGVMKDGKLLCEESPTKLVARIGCDTLEGAYLGVSSAAPEQPHSGEDQPKDEDGEQGGFTDSRGRGCSFGFSTRRFGAEFRKNWQTIMRSKSLLCFQVILPLFISVVWLTAIGNDPTDLKVGIVNYELGAYNDTCRAAMLPPITCTDRRPLSCHYIRDLTSNFVTVEYETVDEGLKALKRLEVLAVLQFPRNFTKSIVLLVEEHYLAPDDVIDQSRVTVWYDNSNFIITSFLANVISNIFKEFFEKLTKTCGYLKSSFLPMVFEKPIYGSEDISVAETNVPAFLIIINFYYSMSYSTAIMSDKRKSNFLKRASLAGVTPLEVLVSEILLQICVLVIQMGECWIVVFGLFKCPVGGSMALMFFLTFVTALLGISWGFIVVLSTASSSLAILSPYIVTSILFILGGVVWPREGLPSFLKQITWISPTFIPSDSSKSIMIKSLPFTDLLVYRGFITAAVWLLIGFVLLYLIARKSKAFTTCK